jgi:hypothetical protein
MKYRFLMVLVLCFSGLVNAEPSAARISFEELYSKITVRGMEFSPKLLELSGKRIELAGFMAPPLKARIEFFVLTRLPMATCPFCSTVADWPPDIVLVIVPKGRELTSISGRLTVRGRLELGVKEDKETGFVSLIRIYADDVTTKP